MSRNSLIRGPLHLELSVQAKAMLLACESGIEVPVTSDLHDSSRGGRPAAILDWRTGLLALKPLQVTSGRDLRHRYLLGRDPTVRSGSGRRT